MKIAIRETPPWTWITVAGLILLAGVDQMRRHGIAADSVIVGSLPNFLAVPVLVFGLIGVVYPKREHVRQVRKRFIYFFASVVLALLGWEFLQRFGSLIFDPNDLIATALGAAVTVVIFRALAAAGTASPGLER